MKGGLVRMLFGRVLFKLLKLMGLQRKQDGRAAF